MFDIILSIRDLIKEKLTYSGSIVCSVGKDITDIVRSTNISNKIFFVSEKIESPIYFENQQSHSYRIDSVFVVTQKTVYEKDEYLPKEMINISSDLMDILINLDGTSNISTRYKFDDISSFYYTEIRCSFSIN